MIGAVLITGVVVAYLTVAHFKRTKHHLPPGPKPLPLIGNIMDMPTVRPWETYREWCRRYDSDVIHLHLPREPVVILGSAAAAFDLPVLEKRSQIYSDRMRYVVAQIAGWGFNVIIMPYAAKWRAHRKLFHQHFQQSAVGKYMPVQLRHSRNFLVRAMKSPENTRDHVRLMITASIVDVVYGKEVVSMDDEYVAMAELSVEGFTKCLIPGAYLTEYLPFLRHIPSWVPGTKVRKMVEKYLPYITAIRDQPYAEVRAAYNNGTPTMSIASTMCEEVLSNYGGTSEETLHHEVARNVSCVTYGAGIDSITSTTEAILLALALFPEAQKKGQAELDRVVGPGRLPEIDDIPNLPYVRAVVMESIRWLPVLCSGVPHSVTADDTYKGYHIAKGTGIIPNIWTMLRDPEDYPEPEKFMPERFLDEDGKHRLDVRDPTTIAFGFGRRTCPGKSFALNSMALFAASALHAFNITAGVDAAGEPKTLSSKMIGAFVAKPQDVPCGFQPRSESAAQLIRALQLDYQ